MGDHLVLVVDRLSTNSSTGILNRSEKPALAFVNKDESIEQMLGGSDSWQSRLVQCRICHDEDEDSKMETPCSCSGTLKYAHRKCVQRWCNEKGDTVCEICRQQLKPGYKAPPQPSFHYDSITTNFWGILGNEELDLFDPHFTPWSINNHDFLGHDEHELYSVHSPQSVICCRIIALIFILLLFLRLSLPAILTGALDFPLFDIIMLLLRSIGIFLLAYLVVKTLTYLWRRHYQRDVGFSSFTSEEESESTQMPVPELRVDPMN